MPGEEEINERLRRLPAVDQVLRRPEIARLLARAPRWAVVEAVREAVAALREVARSGADGTNVLEVNPDAIEAAVARRLRPSLRRVVNATGVVLHTNLGRAPLAAAAVERLRDVAARACNLEYDLERGARGSRHDHVEALVAALSGAEAACVVNNNAAALLLVLQALASGREVVVSRGELVEIGGSFRLPDVMRLGGARLREVGTTNRTHPDDYRRAIGPDTALLLKVHQSNFAMVGFTASVDTRTLAAIGRDAGLPTVVDLGSGCFADLRSFGLPPEPRADEALAEGADLCTFSGDKLLGGPQAGIICGRRILVEEVRRHPLMRAVRPDKLTLAALEATLELYRDGRASEIPVLAMLAAPLRTLEHRANALASAIRSRLIGTAADALDCRVERVPSAVGGGALPLVAPESFAVALSLRGGDAAPLDEALRGGVPPVVGRIASGALLLDVRTISDADLDEVASAVARAVAAAGKRAASRIDAGGASPMAVQGASSDKER